MSFKKIIVLLIISFFYYSSVISQDLFKNFSTQDGLSHKTVYCLFEDSKGFIWIGTTNGLNRFDGYNFKKFFYDENDSTSICGNFITEIVESPNGLLWIATTNGYCYYNPINEKFQKVFFPNTNTTLIPERLCIDNKGTVWGISKGNILSKMNLENPNEGISFKIDSLYKSKLPYNTWNIEYYNDSLWFCTSEGILKLNTETLTGSILKHEKYSFNSIKEIKIQENNKILFVDMTDDLYIYEYLKNNIKYISKYTFYSQSSNLKYLTDAQCDKNNNVWISASPGLFKLSNNDTLSQINGKSGSNIDFSNIRTNCIIIDKKGNVWIGTMDFGLYIINRSNNFFHHLETKNNYNVKTPIIDYIIFEDEKYYSSTYGAFCIKNNSLNHFKLIDVPIQSIYKISDNEIIFIGNERVFKYYRNTGKVTTIFLHTSYIHNSYLDRNNILWLMCWGKGIEGIDLNSMKHYKIDIDTVDYNNNIVYTMLEDSDGTLWLGMFGNGLIQIKDPLNTKPIIVNYSKSRKNPNSGKNIISSLHNDNNGNIWIGTIGGGLERFNKSSQKFASYTTNDGLVSNVIESINSDEYGNIWFTSTIVSKYDIQNKSFSHYDFSDGVTSLYFHSFTFKDKNGIIYFGDDSGLLYFNPSKIKQKETPKTPNLTTFKIYGTIQKPDIPFEGIVSLKQSIDYTKKITLPYNYNSISFEFASVQILENKNIIYSYILEGAEKRWNFSISDQNHANYSGLAPGKYTFKVKASNDRINWSEEKIISLEILPPWWKTWWFKALSSILIIVILVFIFYLRIRSYKRINAFLEKKVKEKTKDLEFVNKNLLNQNLLLKEHKDVLKMKNQDLKDALDLKDKLIGIISHDFKNPLSALQGYISLMKQKYEIADKTSFIKMIQKADISVKKLVDQMVNVLDWAQDQLYDIKVTKTEINVESLIIDTIQLLQETANLKNIQITTQIDCSYCAIADARMTSTIFRNLLHNAIKYTYEGGNIIITINEDDTMHEISFIDTGIGMPEDVRKRLFASYNPDNISSGTALEKGTGLGLQICKAFIEKNLGTIEVKSEENYGSVFTITLPKGETKISKRNLAIEQQLDSFSKELDAEKIYSILLIDDNEELVSLLHNNFSENYKVFNAYDGKMGLHIAQHMLPNIIICDINMPNKNGFEFCREIKNNNITSHIPIILISSEKRENVEKDSYNCGANDFIEKPFDIAILKYKVQMLLEAHLKNNTTDNMSVSFDLPESEEDILFKKMLNIMTENIDNPDFDVSNIASQIGLSRTQLWRKVKNSTNYTPSELLRELRMKKAIEMLNTGNYRVSDIAYSVGFNDPKVFQKSFSKIFGLSPSEYLKNNKK